MAVTPREVVPPGGVDKNAIWVGGLSVYTKEDRLLEFFEDCGEIVSCEVFYDNATGRPLGRGRVEFASDVFKRRALILDQKDIDGRSMFIRDWGGGGAVGGPLAGVLRGNDLAAVLGGSRCRRRNNGGWR